MPPHDRMSEHGYFLPWSFTIPAIHHIIDNLNKDNHVRLKGWPDFYAKLKHLEDVLTCREHRDRFIKTCVRGTAHEGFEHLFRSWSKTLYESRWHETTSFVMRRHHPGPRVPMLAASREDDRWSGALAIEPPGPQSPHEWVGEEDSSTKKH